MQHSGSESTYSIKRILNLQVSKKLIKNGKNYIFEFPNFYSFLAHLIGRPPSSVVHRRTSSSTHFKYLLLRNNWANQSQISYEASTGWGNEN